MAVTVVIRNIEAKLVTRCPIINEDQSVQNVSAPDVQADMQITCISEDNHTTRYHSVPVFRHSNASELVNDAIHIAMSYFCCGHDDVIVLNSNHKEIPLERIIVDLPNQQQRAAVAVEEEYLPMREVRVQMIGLEGIVQSLKAYSAK